MKSRLILLGILVTLLAVSCDKMIPRMFLDEHFNPEQRIIKVKKPLEDLLDPFCPLAVEIVELDTYGFEITDLILHAGIWADSANFSGDCTIDIHFGEDWRTVFETPPAMELFLPIIQDEETVYDGSVSLDKENVDLIASCNFNVGFCLRFEDLEGDTLQDAEVELFVEYLVCEIPAKGP